MNNSKVLHSPATCFGIAVYLTHLLLTGCQQNQHHEDAVLVMQRQVSFPEIELVDKKIREECDITTHLSDDIQYYAKPHFPRIDLVDSVSANTPGKALFVRVTILKGGGRGSHWSGERYMVVEGVLWNHGAKIGNFVAQRKSHMTVDSCMSLARVSRALGKDIGNWLASPALDARLGDAK